MKVLTNEELKDLDLTKILKVGDKVWSIIHGKGKVKEINLKDDKKAIGVEFKSNFYIDTHITYFTNTGKYWDYHLYPSLYLYEIPAPEYKIPIKFEKDELVWVKFSKISEWQIRYYHVSKNDGHYVYESQLKSNETDCSNAVLDIRKFSDNPLL